MSHARFFAVVVLLCSIGLLGACGGNTAPQTPATTVAGTAGPATSQQQAIKVTANHEAPLLAEMVKASKLPPIDQRLPENPMLVQPEERIGMYGGVWHMAMVKTENNLLIRKSRA